MVTAKDVMNSDVVSIRPDATVEEAIGLLLEYNVTGVPVTDAADHLVGIISEFALMAVAYDPHVRHHSVSEHMTRQVVCVDEDDPINKVADLCILHRIRRLPVMRDGRVVGVISRLDVLRAACQTDEAISSVSPLDAAVR